MDGGYRALGPLGPALAGIRALLLDLDGVLVSRGRPIPGAGHAIARLKAIGLPLRVITNTSLWSRNSLARRLEEGRIDITQGEIVTALSATVAQLAGSTPGASVYLLGSAEALDEFAAADLRVLSDAEADDGAHADVVVIGDSEDRLTYDNLNRAFRVIRDGARFMAMHRNPWWLTAAGPTLDSGALVVGLEYATGRRAAVAGKPSPTVFRAAFAELRAAVAAIPGRLPGHTSGRLRRHEVAMVGDDLRTDLAPARRLGLGTVLVLTGRHGREAMEAASARAGTFRPDAVAPSIVEVADALVDRDAE